MWMSSSEKRGHRMIPINTIHHSDALSLIPHLPEESIDLILADPPYGDGQDCKYGQTKRGITGNTSPLLGLLAIERSLAALKSNRFCLFFLGQKHLPFIDIHVSNFHKDAASGDATPLAHRVAALLKRWWLGTHQGAIGPGHFAYYREEFTFRFNRRTSRSRAKLFYRLIEGALQSDSVPAKMLTHDI
jgi:hypothetical protein